MCGACGVLGGGPDWVDRVGNPEGVSHGPNLTRTAERQRSLLWQICCSARAAYNFRISATA